jgi:hypothetical protein
LIADSHLLLSFSFQNNTTSSINALQAACEQKA